MQILCNLYYFPSVAYCAYWAQSDRMIVEAQENYQKKSYRNKCDLLSDQGKIRLSVPLQKGKHRAKPYREVKISYDENWIKQHLHSIKASYSQAPYYEHYIEKIERILQKKYSYLFDLNREILKLLSQLLNMDSEIQYTKSFSTTYPDIADLRDNFTNALNNNIASYMQLHSDRFDFVNNLSIIDLLMCHGPAAEIYLKTLSLPFNNSYETQVDRF